MRVAVLAAHRNTASRCHEWIARVGALRDWYEHSGYSVRAVAGEGDSVDDTRNVLAEKAVLAGLDLEIVDTTHNGPYFGSCEDPQRLRQLSFVFNTMLDELRSTDDIVVYAENDLLWTPTMMSALIDHAANRTGGFDVYCPFILIGDGEQFYDIWGFRGLDGGRWGPFKPYHNELNGAHFTEVSSAGSCLAMRAEVARECRIKDDMALVGWCEDVRNHGYRIAACSDLVVRHPA